MIVTEEKYTITKNVKTAAIVLMAIGVASIAYAFMATGTTRAWANLLLSNFYFMAIALAGVFFLAVQYVAEVGWSAGIKRIPMAMGTYLPYAGLIMIIIFAFGHHDLYFWTHEEYYHEGPHFDPILAGKRGYLNLPFYWFRLILYFVIWAGFAYLIRKVSLKEDIEGGLEHYRKSSKMSATFLVLFAVTSSMSAWDFIMSIDAHWFSTLFGWYTFAGMFVSGLTIMTMIILYLKSKGLMAHVNENHIHDLGKFMFAFSIFWTYLWFSQFMLIWYSNLPEEVTYFMERQGSYRPFFVANFIINFFCPFLILMTRDAKRKVKLLLFIGTVMFIGHWIDAFLMIMPGTVGSHYHIGIPEIGTTCFFAGLFIWVVFNSLSKAPLVAKNHPMLEESLHHHI